MSRTVIVDQSALPPVPNLTSPAGEPLTVALTATRGAELELAFYRPNSRAHIAAALRRRVLEDLDIWINRCSESERERMREKQERMNNASGLATWEAIGGRERVLDRQRREGIAA